VSAAREHGETLSRELPRNCGTDVSPAPMTATDEFLDTTVPPPLSNGEVLR